MEKITEVFLSMELEKKLVTLLKNRIFFKFNIKMMK